MKKLLFLITLSATILYANTCQELLKKHTGEQKEREIFIILDQTTPFSEKIRKNAIVNIFGLLKPKTMVNLFTFSEYVKGKNISLIDRYYFNGNLSKDQRYELGKKQIRAFDECFTAQNTGLQRKLASDLLNNFKEDKTTSSKSEILYTLKKVSKKAVKQSITKQKIVVLLSDMLENSNYTSFYGVELKRLDIDKHINIISKNRLFGDFNGADIIVVGAGVVDKENYRDGKDLDRLESLWEEYFEKSNGKLVTFEQELKYPLKEIYQ